MAGYSMLNYRLVFLGKSLHNFSFAAHDVSTLLTK